MRGGKNKLASGDIFMNVTYIVITSRFQLTNEIKRIYGLRKTPLPYCDTTIAKASHLLFSSIPTSSLPIFFFVIVFVCAFSLSCLYSSVSVWLNFWKERERFLKCFGSTTTANVRSVNTNSTTRRIYLWWHVVIRFQKSFCKKISLVVCHSVVKTKKGQELSSTSCVSVAHQLGGDWLGKLGSFRRKIVSHHRGWKSADGWSGRGWLEWARIDSPFLPELWLWNLRASSR